MTGRREDTEGLNCGSAADDSREATPTPISDELTIAKTVGFGGFGGSGKDTAAGALSALHGHRALSFGTYVAALLCQVNPLVDMGNGRTQRAQVMFKDLGYEGSKGVADWLRMLQDLGTGVNDRDPGLWARLVLADAPTGSRNVITGVRSHEQIRAIRDHGGTLVWIHRPGVSARNNHQNDKEVGPHDFDIIIVNDGTVEKLALSLARTLGG